MNFGCIIVAYAVEGRYGSGIVGTVVSGVA